MANKTINAQYKLRGDTLVNLETKNAVYGVNEPVVVLIPADVDTGTKAATLLKLGDGSTAFNDLPYLTALAGDVPEWAKSENKPEYTAEEIENLDTYISEKAPDTDTQYKMEQDSTDAHILKLFAKGKNDTEWTVVATITTADTVYDDTALKERVDATETAITNLKGEDGDKSVRTIVIEELTKQLIPENAKESLDTLTEIATWIQNHPDDASAINQAIDDLTKLIGVLPEDAESTTVVSYIKEYADAAIAALKIGDYAKAADLAAAVGRISDLETAIEGKVDKVEGKGLSTNDYTNEDKEKLNGIHAGATKVEASETNGNIKVNDVETEVYQLPDTVLHTTDTIIIDGGNA